MYIFRNLFRVNDVRGTCYGTKYTWTLKVHAQGAGDEVLFTSTGTHVHEGTSYDGSMTGRVHSEPGC